jgi:LTXXQ motif family protein
MPFGSSERAESISDLPLMTRVSKVIALLLAVFSVPSSVEARRWRYYGDFERYSRTNDTQERAPGTGFAAALEQWIRGCKQEALEWKSWPLELVAQIARVDDAQRNALVRTQAAAENVAETLASSCPSDSPASLADKFDLLDHVLEGLVAGLDRLRPSIEAFYSALNDEQKARLVALYMSQASSQRPEQNRRPPQKYPPTVQQDATCQQWAGSLRAWPMRQIESGMPLSDDQKAALYTLSGSVYRAAAVLTASCPTENSFTPLGQLDAKRARVDTLRQAVNVVRPDVARFTNALSGEQKARLVAILGDGQIRLERRRSRGDDD